VTRARSAVTSETAQLDETIVELRRFRERQTVPISTSAVWKDSPRWAGDSVLLPSM
jgi:hypothetical protein